MIPVFNNRGAYYFKVMCFQESRPKNPHRFCVAAYATEGLCHQEKVPRECLMCLHFCDGSHTHNFLPFPQEDFR